MKHPDRQQGSVNQHEEGVCWERWECLFKMRGQLSELFSLINVTLGHFTFHFNWSVIGEILETSTFEWPRNRLAKPECLWGQFPLSLWVQVFIQGAEWQSGLHRTGLLGL